MLLFIGFWGLLGLTIIAIVFCMVIFGLSYFFIKRARLYFSMLKELKKSAVFPLGSHESKIRGQNVAQTSVCPLSLKESTAFWPKECKVIFFISLIFAVVQAGLSTATTAGWKSDTSVFITLLFSSLFVCFLFFAPIIALLCIRLTSKLKKAIQQLEEAIVQQDQAIRIQEAIGGKNDQ